VFVRACGGGQVTLAEVTDLEARLRAVNALAPFKPSQKSNVSHVTTHAPRHET
jgi:hypothetical protein